MFKYINSGAITFSDFLKSQDNYNPLIFDKFIQCVGGALAAIEEQGLVHGDLHEGNILVVPDPTDPSVAREFWVIDFIGVPSSSSPEIEISSDIENFKNHLLQAAIIACKKYPGYSVRYILGERAFRVLEHLRENKYSTFKELLTDFRDAKHKIPVDYFKTPAPEPFEWLRVEWILETGWLYKLFEPVPSRFETINRFGNTWISGPRGCGKSHYLRVLAFNPAVIVQSRIDTELDVKLKQLDYDFKKAFGVLFACRLGEFKAFCPEAIRQDTFDFETQRFLKHILVLKIMNKTFCTIMDGLKTQDPLSGVPVIAAPSNLRELINFLVARLGSMAIVSTDPISTFQQCISTTIAKENSAITVWNDPPQRPDGPFLNENDIDSFFSVIKGTFTDLSKTRFYILVDDASFSHFHFEIQKILNSLIRAGQANHCFKITCDKYSYTLDTMDGRSIDPQHEVTYVDLGEISTKSQRKTVLNLSQYMMKVVDTRLKAAKYEANIQELLGTSQNVHDFLSALSLPGARRPKKGEKLLTKTPRANAYYAGWNIIWQLSHGSVRTLLELIEYIFKQSHVTQHTKNILLKAQDEAVRSYSNRHYKALSMLPGEINGETIGEKLQSVISAIGQISALFLKNYDTKDETRWYETISIERLDRKQLSRQAQTILFDLAKHGLLLDEGITFSRAQFGLCQRYDMNKIFAPAFETTYRVRNHLFLSSLKLEELLLNPSIFVKRYKNNLSIMTSNVKKMEQVTLFQDDD